MDFFWGGLRVQETAVAGERALAHLARAGERGARLRGTVRSRLGSCYYNGPMPVDEALERIQALRTGEQGLLGEAWSSIDIGRLHAMKGEIDRAREFWSFGRQAYFDAGLLLSAASFAQGGAEIAFRAGDLRSEETLLRDSLEILEGIGERGFYATQALMLAECLYRAGADDREIEELCARAREATAAEDLVNFVWLEIVSGLLHTRRGEYEQAEERSRRAVALTETTDFHRARSFARAYLAEVLVLSGRGDEAAEVAAEAFEIFEAKGDVAGGAQFRTRLSSLGVEVT
jgi:tetratricopeptide (TPR) repeat protein